MNKLEEILKLVKDIEYGFIDSDGIVHTEDDIDYNECLLSKYRLLNGDKLLDISHGICWDLVEIERYYLDKFDYIDKSYAFVYYDKRMDPVHTIMTTILNNKYYWIESSWKDYKGIHEYDTLDEMLDDVKDKFIKSLDCNEIDDKNLVIYKYNKPDKEYSCVEFYEYLENSMIVDDK